ncbi:LuxR family transcriptional regulator (plasmid) [Rhizobium sp. T1470]|uniref:LuxR family transcriptional regulator n=1 Tax=unclassified Rhizobium TaxID=2613769 RepID=UPI001AEEB6C4|nr:LuxR family transcriptional regulator [Rhizobium sp. T1473]MCA0806363.1 autoinducer binding domain-containing protein [Rhizobium sp. T1473]
MSNQFSLDGANNREVTTDEEIALAFDMFLSQLNRAICIEQLFDRISVFARNFDCRWIAYGPPAQLQDPHRQNGGKRRVASNYPLEWQEYCVKKGYDMIDPSVKTSRFHSAAFRWSEVYAEPSTTDSELRVFDEAAQFGLRSGVTIPLHGPWGNFSTMSFARTERCDLGNSAISYLQLAAFYYHIKVIGCLELSGDHFPRLSVREKECILWVAKGKSSWSIGNIIGISPNTVDFHVKNVMRKLETGSRTVAALKAARLGIIEP